MLQIMIACTRNGQLVPTGIETDVDTFIALGAVFDSLPGMRWQSLLDQKPDLDLQHGILIAGAAACRELCPPKTFP
jgi:hypothetical protein